ncbi:RHS repeat domain-containing protein [Kribbella capetownensis]|nr:RHS repeat protein [Kribbella capetownensis]
MRLIGQLVSESDGGPLGGFNVCGYAYGGDDEILSLGYGTADEDGSFSLEAGWSETSPTGDFLRLRFEVLDGRLDLIHALEQEITIDSPDSPVTVTVVVPFALPREAAEPPEIRTDVARLRVVPEQVTVALGARLVLLAEAQDGGGVPVDGVRMGWRAQDADGQEVPVSTGGEFVGRLPGVYRITASGGGREGAAEVTVRGPGATPSATALAAEDGEVGPRWNDGNAASAVAPVNRVGRPSGPSASALQGRPWLGLRRAELMEAVTVGSANFTFSAPILRLEGRGMDRRLDLTYNSRLWNRIEDQIDFDVDQGWPAPGWSLGFGHIVRLGRQGSMLVDADGTRHPYEVVRMEGNQDRRLEFTGRTTDGSFIDYQHIDDFSGGFQWAQARYPDGMTIEYTARGHDHVRPVIGTVTPSWGVLFPTRVTDASGNVITIGYRNNVGPEIDTIVDTLGRTINFHYEAAGLGQLTAITGPGLDGTRRTLVRLNWVRMRLEPAFAGLEIVRRDRRDPLVLRAIYYPGDATGYWFGDPWTYSAYGMATRVTRHRGMGFDNASLTQAGSIIPGTMTQQRSYNYPLAADPALTDVPTYTTMTETWDGMDSPAAVTRFAGQPDASPRRVEATYPNGTRTVTLAYNRPGQFDDGLPYQQEVYDGGQLVQLTTNIWQQGDYRSPRLSRVEATRGRNLMTATEYDYGPYNRVTEIRELDFGGTAVLRRTRTEYAQNPGYLARHIFALPTVVEVFHGTDPLPTARTEYVYDSQPLRDTPGVAGHAQTHNPYAPRVWVPSHDELICIEDQHGIERCRTIHHAGYWQTEYDTRTEFRGNLTEIRRYANPFQPRDPVIERRTYDITGNLVSAESGRCERSAYEYTIATQYAYPERQVHGPASPASAQILTSTTYDFGTGLATSTTDSNGRTTQASYEPSSLRPQLIIWPTAAMTAFGYDDEQVAVTQTTRAADGSLAGQQTTVRNGLGLVKREATLTDIQRFENPELGELTVDVVDITDRQYDALGRLWRQSRPYRNGHVPVFTEMLRDSLGRVTHTRAGDGSETSAFYDERPRPDDAPPTSAGAYTTRLVDAWGRQRWTSHDALGQLQAVVEPHPDSDGSVLTPGTAATYYIYNALGQVVGIVQRSPASLNQIHSFVYDGLGRLTHQFVPGRSRTLTDAGEYRGPGARWTDVFAYTDGTRLAWSVDARGVRVVFDYGDDGLGRLQGVTYQLTSVGHPANPDPANPPEPASAVRYEYVPTGDLARLLRVTTDDAVEEFGYDDHGRLASKTVTLPDQPRRPFAIDYGYDGLDRLLGITYPAQYGTNGSPRKQVELEYDLAGRVRHLTLDGRDQASEITYAPCGLPASMTVGAGRQPITEIYECNPANGLPANQRILRDGETLLDLSNGYQHPGQPGTTGQLFRLTDNLDTRRTTTYEYDTLGRLRQVSGGPPDSPLWNQLYTYDRYGNRTNVAASGTDPDGAPMPPDGKGTLSFSTPLPDGRSRTDNRITSAGYAYDEAGNLTRMQRSNGAWLRCHYDAPGRLVRVTDDAGTALETYTYAADRRRIRTRNDQAGTQILYIWRAETVLTEYEQTSRQPRWSRALVYLGQRLLCTHTRVDAIRGSPAGRPANGAGELVRYHHPGRLGTRLITTPETGEIAELVTLPYGTRLHGDRIPARTPIFTSYDRSPITDLDYAVNRHYDPRLGRFLQPDPLGMTAIQLGQPQGNNAYTYTESDPINRLDPAGLRWIEGVWIDDGVLIGDEILVEGRPLSPGRAGDSPDESAREAMRGEGRDRGEAGRGASIDGPVEILEAGLGNAGRIIAVIARLLSAYFHPFTPLDPSELPRPSAPQSYQFDAERAAEEAARRRGAGGPPPGGTGVTLIISFHPGIYRLGARLDSLVRPGSADSTLY